MTDNRNTILAVILSGLVLLGWQYFFNIPQMEKQRAQSQIQAELAKQTPQGNSTTPQGGAAPTPSANSPAMTQPASTAPAVDRDTAIASAPRVKIDTPRLSGGISLKGAASTICRWCSSAKPSTRHRPRSCCIRPREP